MKPREQRFIKIEAPFLDERSGFVIDKMLDKKTQNTLMLKSKFVRNEATLDATNSSSETVIFNSKERLGKLDFWSIGYCKIKHGVFNKTSVNALELNQQMYFVISLISL